MNWAKVTLNYSLVRLCTNRSDCTEIDDDGLLGIDVLQNRHDGPTDLMMSKGILKMGDKEVPIMQVGIMNRTRKVTAADHSIIPAQSEAIIDVYVSEKSLTTSLVKVSTLLSPLSTSKKSTHCRWQLHL